jgi:phenylpropionate dioxygenase-like ring-hydroxylating dioxygenase large terminal subunit
MGVDPRSFVGATSLRVALMGVVLPAMESDLWPALRQYWHPVAYASDVSERPVPIKLLDERLVLFRLESGLACFHDLCIHRGTPLSLGWAEGNEIVCAYHGWRYNAQGACTLIPALRDRPISRRARIKVFRVTERYGLIWVCLDQPRAAIPEFPEGSDPRFTLTHHPPAVWKCSAARHTENTVDAAHFPWVHEGILGTRDHPEVPVFEISRHGEELQFEYEDLPNPMHPMPHRRVYRMFRPFTIHQRKVRTGVDDVEASLSTVCPNSAKLSTGFLIIARSFHLDPAEALARFQTDELIRAQDKPVVENQRPEELPMDLAAELHIKGPDAVAVEYRRFMAELHVDVDAFVPVNPVA